MSTAFRRGRPGDLAALAALEARCFPRPWSASALAPFLEESAGLVVLAEEEDGNEVCAYAAFLLLPGEAELLRVATALESRRQGLGRRLLIEGLSILEAGGRTVCHLEAAADNQAAIALYQGCGFGLAGRRPGYYPGGVDALLWRRPATPAGEVVAPRAEC